ncbi:hypothetical protein BDN70DRAFT_880799 [Pholiota conissans]|uniref:Uncharacterized protein n=1 Tax=Pholiota conissans TaxID=109636 RepID=A0A9P5Z1J5_9AGAR|nr:hypothetical protein BDN70DRAFT_880799 [Pholiota conissans]
MPFSTDTSWPPGLLKMFEACRNKPEDYCFYGPYDKLLNYCFGDNFNFYVLPQNSLENDRMMDFGLNNFAAFLFVVDRERRPVLIAEIKDPKWETSANYRFEADKQLRHWISFWADYCVLPSLWGLSLLGTSVRVYSDDFATRYITPLYQRRPCEDCLIPKEFLKDEWNMDILSQEGFDKMKKIVEDIAAAAAL